MTNLIVAVITVLTTNWVTVSRTTPVLPNVGANYALAIYCPTTLNQHGTVVTNFIAQVVWKGNTNEVLLESVRAIGVPILERSVTEDNGVTQLLNLAVPSH